MLVAIPLSAEDSDAHLLRAILCELKELRAAVQQGQVVAPLIEANLRERDQLRDHLAKLEEEQSMIDQAVEGSLAQQAEFRAQLQALKGGGRSELSPEDRKMMINGLTGQLKQVTKAIPARQAEQSRKASEVMRVRSRLEELEDEFDSMQRQMRTVASASGTICETPARPE